MKNGLRVIILAFFVVILQACSYDEYIEYMTEVAPEFLARFGDYGRDEEDINFYFDGSRHHAHSSNFFLNYNSNSPDDLIAGFKNNRFADSLSISGIRIHNLGSGDYSASSFILRLSSEELDLDTEINLIPERQYILITKKYSIVNSDIYGSTLEYRTYQTTATVTGGHISFSLINIAFYKPISGTFEMSGYYTDMDGETRTFTIEDGSFYVYFERNFYR